MAAFAQDSFTDANATNLQSHAGETGAAWAKLSGYSGNAVINGNRLENTTTDAAYYASGSPAGADYDVEADYSWISSQLCDVRLLARADTVSGDFYAFYYRRGANSFRLEKRVSGSFTTLASASGGNPAEDTFVNHRLSLSGSGLEGFADDVSVLATSDASIGSAGKAGVAFTSTGSSAPRVRIDNFLAEDASAGAADLDPADAAHGHSADSVSLTQAHSLGIDSTALTHMVGAVSLAQHSEIIVSTAEHAHTADAVTLVQGSGIIIADGAHGHTALSLALGQQHVLAVQAAFHAHSAVHATLMPEGIFPPASRRVRAADSNRTLKADDGHSASASQRRKIQPEL